MKKYILTRLVKSIVSVFVVVSIVVIMVFTMIPRSNIFSKDSSYTKIKGNNQTIYKYTVLENLGYLDYLNTSDMCLAQSDSFDDCSTLGSSEHKRVLDYYRSKGYVIEELTKNDDLKGQFIAYRDYTNLELITRYLSQLVQFDHPNKVQDANNPNLQRSYSFGGSDGNWGLICSGCESKYQLYFNLSFPFIHQNIISFNFGKSFPTFSGVSTLDVINSQQGVLVNRKQTFPTGVTSSSPIIQSSCKYKPVVDHLDQQRFTDNYANCQLSYSSPSMVMTSYIFGLSSLILAYAIALPWGISMARNKGKWQDKIGTVYINLLIAVPSLAFIFFLKYIGFGFGLPDKFSQFGYGDFRSYILPIIILALLSTSGIMMWIRRYMVDQTSADYVKFAKAKGLSQKEIFRNHILKNAIIPITNSIPSSVILAISGAVITESVFSIPGMGKMLPDAIKASNNNMVITLTFIFTALSIFSVFLGDLLMILVDPRISLVRKKGE